MIAARRQRHDEALQSLRRALYLDDSLALGHFWLGNLYRDRGDVARACHEYENVVRDWEHHTLRADRGVRVGSDGGAARRFLQRHASSVFKR